MFLQDPVTTVKEFGPYVGGVVVCAGLFIWSSVQLNALSLKMDENTREITNSNTELKEQLSGQLNAQRDLAQSVYKMADAIHRQADVSVEELSIVREMTSKQDVLAANQTTIMSNFQRMVEQLISLVSGAK